MDQHSARLQIYGHVRCVLRARELRGRGKQTLAISDPAEDEVLFPVPLGSCMAGNKGMRCLGGACFLWWGGKKDRWGMGRCGGVRTRVGKEVMEVAIGSS